MIPGKIGIKAFCAFLYIMKINVSCLLCLLSALYLFAGCNKSEGISQDVNKEPQKEEEKVPAEKVVVEFGSSTSGSGTKTAYSDEKYFDEGLYFYRVSWLENDRVGILSPEISASQSLYSVKSPENNGRYSTAKFKAVDAGSALCWGEPGDYTFYGMYPYSEGCLTSDGKAEFSLPQDQTPDSEQWSGDSYVASPNPDYMFMTAGTCVAKSREVRSPKVTLPFVMLPTVLRFKISGAADMTVKSISLISGSDNLCGSLSAAITAGGGFPTCVSDNGQTSVSMTFNGGGHASIAKGKYLEFSFFLLPIKDLSNLTFRIALDYDSVESVVSTSLKVGGQAYVFNPHKRYDVEGLVIPNAVKWTIREMAMVTPWTDVEEELN